MRILKFSGTVTLQYDTPFSPFTANEYEQGLDWLAKEGFDGAEICISDYCGVDVCKVKDGLDRRGLGCSTISTGQSRTREGISLLHDGEKLEAAQERMKQHIDAASVLHSHVTLGLLRGLGESGQEERDMKTLAKNMDPILDYAEKRGVTIILEAINRYETCLLNSVESVMYFIETQLGNPQSIGVLWDVFHANIEDPDVVAAIDRMGKRLKHVHLADSNRWFPGYGHLDFTAIMKKLKATGFDGYLSYECLNLPSVDAVRKESGNFIRAMREI